MDNPPNQRDLGEKIKSVSDSYGLPLDPAKTVGELSVGERQRVEIIRCLLQNPKLLVMDEPTSVLTPQEVDILFKTLLKLKSEGTSILYISHKLEEIRKLCDTATILRLGKKVDTCTPKNTSTKKLAEMMVGSSIKAPEKLNKPAGQVLLKVDSVCFLSKSTFGTSLKNVTFDLRQGEILGIGGVAGNGQDELFAVLSGEQVSTKGSISFKETNINKFTPNQRRQIGLLSAPEERLGHAAAPNMSLIENILITSEQSQNLVSKGFIDWKKSKAFAEKVINQFDVRTPGSQNTAGSLSGGNLQKFVIGREILQKPSVFIVNQPTWGVDAAAASSIRQALLTLSENGAAILVISQDLDELLEISDQFAALNEGALTKIKTTAKLSLEQIGLMMGGAKDLEANNA
jgi:simple sugar transport system ATP-binding protein